MADSAKALVLTIAIAGTPTQVSSSLTSIGRVRVRNPYSNTGRVYVGGSDLDATHRFSLQVGEVLDIFNIDLTGLYVTVEMNNETVELLWYI